MTILTIILVLLIERILWDADPHRNHSWLNPYFRWMSQQNWLQALSAHPATVLLQLLPVLLLTAWLQSIFHDGWNGVLELLFGGSVLLFSLGPKDLGRAGDAYLDAQHDNATNSHTDDLCTEEISDQEPLRALAVSRCILSEANNRLFAPLFWFVLLGPVGAVGYRCLYLLANWKPPVDREPLNTGLARYLLDWAPARITALGYATAGNFEAVIRLWDQSSDQSPENDASSARQLLQTVGPAALDSYPSDDELEHMTDVPPVVEDALALVWRTLSLWIIILLLAGIIIWLA